MTKSPTAPGKKRKTRKGHSPLAPSGESVKRVRKARDRRKRAGSWKGPAARPTKTRAAYENQRGNLIASRRIPEAEFTSRGKAFRSDLYRWVGLDRELEIIDFLHLLDKEKPKPRGQISIGTGYGKYADWVGSPWDLPRGLIYYLQVWRLRKSSERVFEVSEGPYWYELELIRVAGTAPRTYAVKVSNAKPSKKKRTKKTRAKSRRI